MHANWQSHSIKNNIFRKIWFQKIQIWIKICAVLKYSARPSKLCIACHENFMTVRGFLPMSYSRCRGRTYFLGIWGPKPFQMKQYHHSAVKTVVRCKAMSPRWCWESIRLGKYYQWGHSWTEHGAVAAWNKSSMEWCRHVDTSVWTPMIGIWTEK